MPSISSSFSPRPKLRLPRRSLTPGRPHTRQRSSPLLGPDRDEDDVACGADRDDAARRLSTDGLAPEDVLGLMRVRVALARDDLAREDDALEIEDAEFVIVKLVGGMK